MIRLLLGPGDLERVRFAYSPLAEVVESVSIVQSGQIPATYQGWFDQTRKRLRQVDMAVLRAVIPALHARVASFLLAGAWTPSTAIEEQLKMVADCPPKRLRADLKAVWCGQLPPETERILELGGGPRIAGALWQYWNVAVKPYWPRIRALLGADVAYRTSRLAAGGIEALLSELHPQLELVEHVVQVQGNATGTHREPGGTGLLLVPCVFAGQQVMADFGVSYVPSIIYGPRGIDDHWPTAEAPPRHEDGLAAALGRSQSAILVRVGLPKSTSDLARELDQSIPVVGEHLAALRRSGLVTSWQDGRREMSQRTPLATSVAAASVTFPSQHGSRKVWQTSEC